LVQYTLGFGAALSLDAAAVAVVRIGPEEIANCPDQDDAWYDSETYDEGDGCC
jgi:hypothetical protein